MKCCTNGVNFIVLILFMELFKFKMWSNSLCTEALFSHSESYFVISQQCVELMLQLLLILTA